MIAAIIVLYAPELTRLRGNIQLLQTLQWPVIVIDNSPESHRELLSKGIVYHHLASNKGIAAAQNLGLQAAKELGAKTAMLLDQDSLLSEQFLIQSAQRFATAQGLFPNLAALGPSIVSEFSMQTERARLQRSKPLQQGFSQCKQIIASGMMIPLERLQQVGVMEEALFIDGVDHEWCWRAVAQGLAVYQDDHNPLVHRQGEGRYCLFGMRFKVGHPLRLYYQFRNILILSRRSYVPLYWKARNLLGLPVRLLINRFCLDEGPLRGKYMLQGLKDGIKCKTGPYSVKS